MSVLNLEVNQEGDLPFGMELMRPFSNVECAVQFRRGVCESPTSTGSSVMDAD